MRASMCRPEIVNREYSRRKSVLSWIAVATAQSDDLPRVAFLGVAHLVALKRQQRVDGNEAELPRRQHDPDTVGLHGARRRLVGIDPHQMHAELGDDAAARRRLG